MFDSWPINAKQRSNAEKLIRNYSSGVTAKSLFLISRKNEKETYERRFYDETNPNGLCGGISLFQLDQRHRHGYSATSSFRNKALDFHDSDSRNEFIKFLENIQQIQSSSESEEILSSVRAMIDWTQQKCFTSRIGRSSNKSPMIFPLEKWWHSLWYTEIHDVIPLTLLNNENDRSNIDLSRLLDSLFIHGYCCSRSQIYFFSSSSYCNPAKLFIYSNPQITSFLRRQLQPQWNLSVWTRHW